MSTSSDPAPDRALRRSDRRRADQRARLQARRRSVCESNSIICSRPRRVRGHRRSRAREDRRSTAEVHRVGVGLRRPRRRRKDHPCRGRRRPLHGQVLLLSRNAPARRTCVTSRDLSFENRRLANKVGSMQVAETSTAPERQHRVYWWKEAIIVGVFYAVYSWTRNQFGSNKIAADGIPDQAFTNAVRVIRVRPHSTCSTSRPCRHGSCRTSGSSSSGTRGTERCTSSSRSPCSSCCSSSGATCFRNGATRSPP